MTNSSLDNFHRDINQILEYLKHIQYTNDIAEYVPEADSENLITRLSVLKEHNKTFGTDKKIFEYKATIISLYGILERYIEVWIKEYLDSLAELLKDYSLVDETIRNHHFSLSLKLINTISTKEIAKFQHITKEQVLANLNSCIVNPQNFKFNTDAFIQSTGNLKHSKIVELFKPLKIKIAEGLKANDKLNNYIKEELHIINIANKDGNLLYNKINDIVERRNLIAHGSNIIDDILDRAVLTTYINFVRLYCEAIFECLLGEYTKQESLVSFQQVQLVHNVWKNSIVGFEIENYTIKINDLLIIQTANNLFFKTPILELQKNRQSYEELQVIEKTDIAVRVEIPINMNCKFHLSKKAI
jgi:hypothetical protein